MGKDVHGVVVVDKPKGPTSHDVVMQVRRRLRTRAIGHAGTLDPMATGVLVLAVGDATKLVPWLTAADKAYAATIKLGIATDTFDAEGHVTDRAPVSLERLDAALAQERARREQVPPAFSAIKIDGVRAHELARAGEEVVLEARPVEVRRLDVVAVRDDELDIVVEVAKGYFVRSLARDLAAALGTFGHLTALRRLASGAFRLEDATPLDAPSLMSLDDAARRALPVTLLDDAGVRAAAFGQRVAPAHMTTPPAGPSAWLDASGRLVAVGALLEDGTGQVLRGFPRSA